MASFEQLSTLRRRLRVLCKSHFESVKAFLSTQNSPTFLLHASDKDVRAGKLRQLTTTATCVQSLLDCPDQLLPRHQSRQFAVSLAQEFSRKAGALKPEDWRSDASAQVYCRVRALPLVVDFARSEPKFVRSHLSTILSQLDVDPERLAVGEAYLDKVGKSRAALADCYPPNGYHTYWTLALLDSIRKRFPRFFRELGKDLQLARRRKMMVTWAWKDLGIQVGLHQASSYTLDTSQLMWDIAIVITYDREECLRLYARDLLRKALECVFATQEAVGTWRRYKPLFHYQASGNAYSHTYEALNAMLRPGLIEGETFWRAQLNPFMERLEKFIDYTELTHQRLKDNLKVWSSGHRTNSAMPEAWATANVFSFLQALRALVGHWTRDAAIEELPIRGGAPKSRDDALTNLRGRGDTWVLRNGKQVSRILERMFVRPFDECELHEHVDPDRQEIAEFQARSAILFGPPGTSKTTLVRAIADLIGWRFVELHASHFVADGLPNVQRTADKIFHRLGELDRCVVFFDEIDELVGQRGGADFFGRFLTTSMLPRLAGIWDARRVLFFVATNNIAYFDEAVVRSERFDALIFVSTPSFARKVERVQALMVEKGFRASAFPVSKKEIEKEFAFLLEVAEQDLGSKPTASRPARDFEKHALGFMVLLRWDELDELALRLGKMKRRTRLAKEDVRRALARMQDRRLRSADAYLPFLTRDRARLDFRMKGASPV